MEPLYRTVSEPSSKPHTIEPPWNPSGSLFETGMNGAEALPGSNLLHLLSRDSVDTLWGLGAQDVRVSG